MSAERGSNGRLAPLALGALGVVFGDIGTSPLYSLNSCFTYSRIEASAPHIYGFLSTIFWTLMLVISLKYVAVVMNADNKGEGGVLALTALVMNTERETPRKRLYAVLGVLGAALFFSDGAITPAISVLSAVEGLHVAAPQAQIHVVPITVGLLIGLFMIQKRGTGAVGKLFGPVMLLWFAVLAIMGVNWIVKEPQVLYALSPVYAVSFLADHQVSSLAILAGVFLTVTGGEALYADMGHFGKAPIRLGWMTVVLPALLLNYFGQGALLMERPQAIANPFYFMAPDWGLLPLVVLATAATIIASQAVISGVFSVTRSAVSRGLLPRVRVEHFSAENEGQIYVPSTNWVLMVASIALVLGFGSSAGLAGAYGLAVSGAMTIVTPLTLSYLKSRDGRDSLPLRVGLSCLFVVDIAFLLANLTKLQDGGWVPLSSGLVIFWLMQTWRVGRTLMMNRIMRQQKPVRELLDEIRADPPVRVPGLAVFLEHKATGMPRALLSNLKFNRVLHERVVLLSVVTREQPRIPRAQRLHLSQLGEGIVRLVADVGFLEKPNIVQILREAAPLGINYDPDDTTFFLSREELVAGQRSDLPPLRRRAFIQMSRSAQVVTDYYGIPSGRVVEIGTRIEI